MRPDLLRSLGCFARSCRLLTTSGWKDQYLEYIEPPNEYVPQVWRLGL